MWTGGCLKSLMEFEAFGILISTPFSLALANLFSFLISSLLPCLLFSWMENYGNIILFFVSFVYVFDFSHSLIHIIKVWTKQLSRSNEIVTSNGSCFD
jgi:hypothetical protein